MKHAMKITILLLLFFAVTQIFGLFLVAKNADVSDGEVTYPDTALGPRPGIQGIATLIYMGIGVAIGTILLLTLIKFKKRNLWRFWFFTAAFIAMLLSLGALMNFYIALALSLILAAWKIQAPNVIIHNVTEVLIYSGIGLFFIPLFSIEIAFWLLLGFSAYDAYAVWKSKHMVKMAEFQTQSNLFAGFTIPYKEDKKTKIKKKIDLKRSKKRKKSSSGDRTAILGGGDVALPLIFAGASIQWMMGNGLGQWSAFIYSLIITLFTTISLAMLFFLADKEKFYPAMPFLTSGCFFGFGVLYIILTL